MKRSYSFLSAMLVALGVAAVLGWYLLLPIAMPLAAAAPNQEDPGPRIVGGENAAVGEIPWQVVVYPGPYLCGGSLIDTQWVVTAAHCVVDNSNNPMNPADVDVVAGEYNRNQNDGTEQPRAVNLVVVHPDYAPATHDNDIALLRLATPVVIGPSVGIIPLIFSPTNDGLVAPGVLSMVSGWGTTSQGGTTAAILQKVQVPIVSNATCNVAYGGDITENMLCAGLAEGGKDSCQGDSGGPLVVADGGNWRLGGVVSFGEGCAQPNYYGVYTRVSRYTDWISTYVSGVTPTATPTATNSPTPTATPTVTGTPPTATPTLPARAFLPQVMRQNTPTSTATPTPTSTPTVQPGLIVNGDFEQGPSVGWQEYSAQGYPLILNSGFPGTVAPHSGQYAVWLGGADDEISYVRQTVTIPAGASILSFWAWIASEDSCGWDFGGVIVNAAVANQFDLCEGTSTGGWARRTVNLGAYAGQNVALQIRAETDESANSNLFVDDVALTNAAGTIYRPVLLRSGLETGAKSAAGVAPGAPAAAPEGRLWAPVAATK